MQPPDQVIQSPGLEARCLRFVGWVTPPRRKTRFQVLVRLSWAGLVTRRVSSKGFRAISSSFPKLTWRNPPYQIKTIIYIPFISSTLDGNGNARFALGPLPRGDHSIRAAYAGDPAFAASMTASALTVAAASTFTTVTPAPDSVYG